MEEQENSNVRRETVVQSEETVRGEGTRSDQSVPGEVLGQRIVYYVGGAILVILAVRFLLLLLGASRASAFVDFVYSLSGIFVAPFNGIFNEPVYGNSVFDSATLVAMLVYAILTVGIAKLFTLNRRDRDIA